MIFSHKFTQDKSRTKASNDTNFKKAETNKRNILEAIMKISKTADNEQEKTLHKWVIAVGHELNDSVSISLITKTMKEEFKEKLSKGPRAKYHLSELIS